MSKNVTYVRILPDLTPWQTRVLNRIQDGGRSILWPRQAGRTTITRYLAMRLNSTGRPLIHKGGKP